MHRLLTVVRADRNELQVEYRMLVVKALHQDRRRSQGTIGLGILYESRLTLVGKVILDYCFVGKHEG